ncbi:unnamed protein product [Lactuca saligna]|uniref:Uncharacterized protein n=1 Tax=Lactuca saligna TaxID=75948 RepID=A0AA35ZWU8_LACSI|nr:unnamed protein product [Lactuca saligna]
MGKRFGFVRFSGNVNIDHMIKNLCEVWFGYHKLFASVPHIHKKEFNFHKEPPKVEKKRENFSVSYANVVRGGHSLPLRDWSKDSFRHILAKWGSIAHLDDNIREDVYKSCVCIITSFLGIISIVIKVSINGEIFPIHIKEAPGWNPTFVCEFNNIANDSVDAINRFEQEQDGSNDSLIDKEDVSLDPFGIYDVMKKNG